MEKAESIVDLSNTIFASDNIEGKYSCDYLDEFKPKGIMTIDIADKSVISKNGSKESVIYNIPWKFGVYFSDSANTKIGVSVKCNEKSQSKLWTCKANITLKLMTGELDKSPCELCQHSEVFTFDMFRNTFTICEFTNADELYIETHMIHGFDRGPKKTYPYINAEIDVISATGILIAPIYNPFEVSPEFGDAVLIIEGKRLIVNRTFLAFHSRYFRTMFFSGFREKEMKEIELKDVRFDDFVELHNYILPYKIKITKENVKNLLDLADRFEMPGVLIDCEQFLLKDGGFDCMEKMKLSERYMLVNLQVSFLF
ncbi:unnamed protein product [Caenorhabditis bovis]|uniref:BTB domain-containing protein n=1 Tax=Caenorhabditis bovis TaxID=2654633 RepID=A0A8S1F3R8_9PELO|nr:unnamed protein product [Caenorhabditis bovis]